MKRLFLVLGTCGRSFPVLSCPGQLQLLQGGAVAAAPNPSISSRDGEAQLLALDCFEKEPSVSGVVNIQLSHHSFWFFKFAAAVSLTVGSFFISEGPFTTGNAP